MKVLGVFFLQISLCFSEICKTEFDETICENFHFTSELILNSGTTRVIIKNATGEIIHENFLKFGHIKEIIIRESDIRSIEDGSLCCTTNLTSISIFKNKNFPKITKRMLQNCQSLKKMYLDNVRFDNGKDILQGIENVQSLTINGSDVVDVIFDRLVHLALLTVSNSNLRTLPGEAFKSLTNLTILSLEGNQIDRIEPETFQNLAKLKVLNLNYNKLKDLTWKEFNGLKSLKVLFLGGNSFKDIHFDNLVQGVPDLERIFLTPDFLTSENRKEIQEIARKHQINVIYLGQV